MAFRMNEVCAMRSIDPIGFRDRLRSNIRRYSGRTREIAIALDVNMSTVKRWYNHDPEMKAYAAQIRADRAA